MSPFLVLGKALIHGYRHSLKFDSPLPDRINRVGRGGVNGIVHQHSFPVVIVRFRTFECPILKKILLNSWADSSIPPSPYYS